MSKKKARGKAKKRKKKRQQKTTVNLRDRIDCHHCFYQKRSYKSGILRELRELKYCKIYICKETTHKAIHALLQSVPVPKEINAKKAIEHLEMLAEYGTITQCDSPEKRLTILAALFDCVEQPTADALRLQSKIIHEFTKKAP